MQATEAIDLNCPDATDHVMRDVIRKVRLEGDTLHFVGGTQAKLLGADDDMDVVIEAKFDLNLSWTVYALAPSDALKLKLGCTSIFDLLVADRVLRKSTARGMWPRDAAKLLDDAECAA